MERYELIEQALIYIENNLEQALTVESVASMFNISKYYFHRLFSAMVGCSLSSYILSRRLNASLQLIKSSNQSLTDIAYRLDFGTQASFTRAFKRQYGIAPSALRTQTNQLSQLPIPSVVKRDIKNMNGDIVTDFTLTMLEASKVSGVAFEVDLATDGYKDRIRAYCKQLLEEIDGTVAGPCYMIYSNCQPDSTSFKALFGVPQALDIDKPFYFTVDVPRLFCAKFRYSGDLLEIGDVLKTDYARFLKISRQETEETHIELIQMFDDIHNLDAAYQVYAPIKKLPIDSDD